MRKPAFRIQLLVAVLASGIYGCNMANDNPTSAEQMQSIRRKEAASRQNYNPSTTPPPAGSSATK